MVAGGHGLDLLVDVPGQEPERVDPFLDVQLHRPGHVASLAGDQLPVLLHLLLDGLHDDPVPVGHGLEGRGDLGGHALQLAPQFLVSGNRGGPDRVFQGQDAVGQGCPSRPGVLGQGGHRVLQPGGANREVLEPLVGVGHQAPDGLVAGEGLQDLRTDLVLVPPRRPPHLGGDLVHQSIRALVDGRQALLQPVFQDLLVGSHLGLERGIGRRGAPGEDAAVPRPVGSLGRGREIRLVHLRSHSGAGAARPGECMGAPAPTHASGAPFPWVSGKPPPLPHPPGPPILDRCPPASGTKDSEGRSSTW